MKTFSFFTFLLLIILSGCTSDRQKAAEKPNVVFILADDLGWADLPAYGNKFNEAPNIDRLAGDGKRFTNAYAACPVCSPSRAAIMTGQYPARVGIIDFIRGHWRPYEKVIVPVNRTQYLPRELKTIGNIMKQAGYATGYFGKWHLGSRPEHHPSEYGFDTAIEYAGGGYYNSKFKPSFHEKPQKRLSEILTDLGVDFIKKNKNRPFFLFLAHFDVHVQLDADTDLIEKYLKKEKVPGYPCNAVYAAMVEHVDRSVGRIVHTVDSLGLSANTIVIFFSDNGGLNKRFDNIVLLADSKKYVYKNDSLAYIASSNAPLRREKGTLYEGGIREPLIVKWPGKIRAGSVSDAVITGVDFYPTLADLTGVKMPWDQVTDGRTFSGMLFKDDENAGEERTIFWHYPVYHHDVPASAVRKGSWKLIQNLVDSTYELYDLEKDISEKNDLAEVNPEKLRELSTLLNRWRKDVGARFPVPNPDFDPARRYEWGKHP